MLPNYQALCHLCSSTPLVHIYFWMYASDFVLWPSGTFMFSPCSTPSQTSLNRILRFNDHYPITLWKCLPLWILLRVVSDFIKKGLFHWDLIKKNSFRIPQVVLWSMNGICDIIVSPVLRMLFVEYSTPIEYLLLRLI